MRILVADDNPDITLSMRLLLEDDGHVVETSETGAGVVEKVEQFHPDACILDIDMPGRNGYAIAEDLYARYRSLRPLMIAISGKWIRGRDQARALQCGFDHFLEKPADSRDVARILEELSRRRAAA